ncbi:MAG: hypothetical protein A3J67_02825 [Parcubacteria group bacterium RIFCSPHIGHO2_02_FULL_48_10b]|nr:MAG: hypothetical protein A3J67_02825 [Parcubacteria group bacterium RIFCSPHIGHO2_02_FULL_48_10b]
MIITIAGVPGAGKTMMAHMLAAHFGIPNYSIGDMRALMARERGLTLDELNTLGERESFTDHEVDEYQRRLGKSGKSCVVEGRLSWYFIPHSFKVFLDVNPEVGAQRIFQIVKKDAKHLNNRRYLSIDDVREMIQYRSASDGKRYLKYYGIDVISRSNFDLVIDTTNLEPATVLNRIVESGKQHGIEFV